MYDAAWRFYFHGKIDLGQLPHLGLLAPIFAMWCVPRSIDFFLFFWQCDAIALTYPIGIELTDSLVSQFWHTILSEKLDVAKVNSVVDAKS